MVAFSALWSNHPANEVPPNIYPCSSPSGAANFENQCAIRLGIALARSGISLSGYTGAFCWHKHGNEHPLRVNDVTRWLRGSRIFGSPEIARRAKGAQLSHAPYMGRSGIVVWINFWGTNSQGDPIDLWDGARIAHGALDYFSRSEEIHFWPVP